jgi:hypothetical protein
MGAHCGKAQTHVDALTGRMDYFGPMVNRAAKISLYSSLYSPSYPPYHFPSFSPPYPLPVILPPSYPFPSLSLPSLSAPLLILILILSPSYPLPTASSSPYPLLYSLRRTLRFQGWGEGDRFCYQAACGTQSGLTWEAPSRQVTRVRLD